jgi:hypothetical protein
MLSASRRSRWVRLAWAAIAHWRGQPQPAPGEKFLGAVKRGGVPHSSPGGSGAKIASSISSVTPSRLPGPTAARCPCRPARAHTLGEVGAHDHPRGETVFEFHFVLEIGLASIFGELAQGDLCGRGALRRDRFRLFGRPLRWIGSERGEDVLEPVGANRRRSARRCRRGARRRLGESSARIASIRRARGDPRLGLGQPSLGR